MTGETIVAAAITGVPGLAAGVAGLWQARNARQQAERAKEKGVDSAAWERAQRITDRAVDRLETDLGRVKAELEAERQARRAAEEREADRADEVRRLRAEVERLRRQLGGDPGPGDRPKGGSSP